MNRARLRTQLENDEGNSRKPYKDTVGVWTIGVGHNMNGGLSRDEFVALATAGPLSDNQIAYLFGVDLDKHVAAARLLFPALDTFSDARQEALVNMTFNLGPTRLGRFAKMLAAIEAGEWNTAADEAQESRWFKQVGARAERIVYALRHGNWKD